MPNDSDQNALALSCMSLVRWIVRGYKRRLPAHVEQEELEGAGYFALVKAAQSFKPGRAPFPIYASICIRREIMKYLRKQDIVSKAKRAKLRETGRKGPEVLRLDSMICDDEGNLCTLEQTLPACQPRPDEEAERNDFWDNMVEDLTDTERRVILMYYRDTMNVEIVAAVLGYTRAGINLIRQRALRYLFSQGRQKFA